MVDTTRNTADHFTKQLGPQLFHRHTDYIMGRVPPQYSAQFHRIHELLRRPKQKRGISDRPMAAAAARLAAVWAEVSAHFRARFHFTVG